MLDVRLPIGVLFSVFGVALTLYGAMSDRAQYARSLGHNVNLWWGLVLLLFGLAFVYFGRRTRAATTSPHPNSTN